jgi:chromate reductase
MTTDSVRVLGVAGSLRKGSFNRALLRAAIEIAAAEKIPIAFTVAEIGDLPLYDDDVREREGFPAPAARFREQIAQNDAILFVSPEYNYSVPGVLKNAIDWASRPPSQPFADKPFSVMGASGGMSGTMRMQYHLRQIAVFLNMHPLNGPEVFVRNAKTVFDADLKLTDEATRQIVAKHLSALVTWTRRIAGKTSS